MTAPVFTVAEKRARVEHELHVERRLFPRLVEMGLMREEDAARQIALLESIAADYGIEAVPE